MTIPGFTGEASLGKTMESHVLTLERAAGGRKVYPQALIARCYEGGHCEWRWVPDPSGGVVHPITKT
jgi:hypothetical protein